MKKVIKTEISRRSFVKSGGLAAGSLLIGISIPASSEHKRLPLQQTIMNSFIRIDSDNTITLLANHSEFGNGAYTIMPMMVAEELDVPYKEILLEPAPTRPEYYSPIFREYLTAGSVTTGSCWIPLRTAGAQARAMLIEAASKKWDQPFGSLLTSNGKVFSKNRQLSISYGDLLETIRTEGIVPREHVVLKDPKMFQVLGKPARRHEGLSKVDGTAVFGIDIKLPNMLYGSMARCPVFGGKAIRYDASSSLKMPGVVKVKEISSGIVVLATSYWAALKGRKALKIEWDEGPNSTLSSDSFFQEYRDLAGSPGIVAENIGDSIALIEQSDDVLEAVYEMPYLAHATMEPPNCTALVTDDRCEIWSGTQSQSNDQKVIAKLLGRPQQSIVINRPLMGGSFGRRAAKSADFTVNAVEAARGEDVPVQVIWSREEDIKGGHYRPLFVHKLRGALDDGGMPLAWHQTVVGQSIMEGTRFAPAFMVNGVDLYSLDGCLQEPLGLFPYGTAYQIPNHRVESHNPPKIGVIPMEWRSVGHSHTGIAYECFLDELAISGGKDPLELRIALTENNPRMNRLLHLLKEKSNWNKPIGKNRGRGIAARVYSVSPIAQVAEVTMGDNGEFKVDRVICVVDCGFAVNPLGIEAQIEGGIAYGLGAAAFGEIELQDGHIKQSNFHDYNVLRIPQMPEIEVYIVPSDEPPTGVGEQATTPIAPAVANALFNATGQRIRRFPLAKSGMKLV